MKFTHEEWAERLKAAGLMVTRNGNVVNPRDGYTIGFVTFKQWSFKEPYIYEITELECSDIHYQYTDLGTGFANQMVNDANQYHVRRVAKDDVDGFIKVCKEFIEWVNATYPREKVLEKQKRDAERREEAFKRLHEWNKKMKERRDKWQIEPFDPQKTT